MSYSGGYDGNSSSKGADNKNSYELGPGKLKLDGSTSCSAQLRVLQFANAEEDLSFKESSVQDITDKGRIQAAAMVQRVLEQLLGAEAVQPPRRTARVEDGVLKRKAASAFGPGASSSSSSTAAPPDEAEMRQQVRQGSADLQKIRLAGGAKRDDAKEIMHQLEDLPMTVSCLKITKIAIEVNQGHWRNNQDAIIRDLSRDLLQRWKSLYRAETGASATVTAAPIGSQRLRTTSMFLEENCYVHVQKAAQYKGLMEGVAERLQRDPEMARDVAVGRMPAPDFVKKVSDERRWLEAVRLKSGMKVKDKP